LFSTGTLSNVTVTSGSELVGLRGLGGGGGSKKEAWEFLANWDIAPLAE
jgi:hypothetical protein